MRIFKGFKREICCADWRVCMVIALATWVAGALSLLLSGAVGCYQLLCKPLLAPGSLTWLLGWMLFYLLLGTALGLTLGRCAFCRPSLFRRGILFWSLFLICTLLWIVLFFGVGLRITALLLIVLAICFGMCTLIPFASESQLSALLMIVCIWWELYGFLLTLLIILWN